MEIGTLVCRNRCIQPYLFYQRDFCIFRILGDVWAVFSLATKRDRIRVDDSRQYSVVSVLPECFTRSNDIGKPFIELSASFSLFLHGLLSDALFYKLSQDMLPQWSKSERISTKSGLSPLFPYFSTSSPQVLKGPLPSTRAKSVLTVHHGTVVDTEAKTKKQDVADNTISVDAQRAQQVHAHTMTG